MICSQGADFQIQYYCISSAFAISLSVNFHFFPQIAPWLQTPSLTSSEMYLMFSLFFISLGQWRPFCCPQHILLKIPLGILFSVAAPSLLPSVPKRHWDVPIPAGSGIQRHIINCYSGYIRMCWTYIFTVAVNEKITRKLVLVYFYVNKIKINNIKLISKYLCMCILWFNIPNNFNGGNIVFHGNVIPPSIKWMNNCTVVIIFLIWLLTRKAQ